MLTNLEQEKSQSEAKRKDALAAPTGSAEYAVEWNGGEGWKRLAQTKPTEQEARDYAKWVLAGEHQEYRIIEITEKILPNDQAHPTAAKATVDGTKNL